MKIDGIDPLILNRIQEQAQRQHVEEADRANTDSRVTRRYDSPEGRPESTAGEKTLVDRLEEALQKLNDTTRALDLSLEFRLKEEREAEEQWKVEVRDLQQDETLKEMDPEEAIHVVAQVQSLVGVLLDVRR